MNPYNTPQSEIAQAMALYVIGIGKNANKIKHAKDIIKIVEYFMTLTFLSYTPIKRKIMLLGHT